MEYSCKVWCKPCRRRLILRLHSRHSWRPSWNIEEEFPDLGLLRRLIKNPEEGVSGGFLGLPKESFYEPKIPLKNYLEASNLHTSSM
ncbi:hypothetical protein Taro_028382 [Colocasia esculenta]|uniref:Uncharacterized protein n=1 Tax=Colocasia esculenta TaxID=4460 RepID=A0A843VX39_COLES|nr:hypothetical protein [Colocasia esculenta]